MIDESKLGDKTIGLDNAHNVQKQLINVRV